MFITGNKKDGFQVHLERGDTQETLVLGGAPTKAGMVGGIVRLTLSVEKAKELEARLEEVVNADGA